jgi:hypothetical protein
MRSAVHAVKYKKMSFMKDLLVRVLHSKAVEFELWLETVPFI